MEAHNDTANDLTIAQVRQLVVRRPRTALDDVDHVAASLRALGVGIRPLAPAKLPALLADLDGVLTNVKGRLQEEYTQHEAATSALQEIAEIHHPFTRAGAQWCHGCSIPRDPGLNTWHHMTAWPCRTYALAAGWSDAA